MTAVLGARFGYWLILILVGVGAGLWLMSGQVADARSAADAARADGQRLSSEVEALRARQAAVDQALAKRTAHSNQLTGQLNKLQGEIQKVIQNDAPSTRWAADCIPAAIADRMRLPPDDRCPR